ncbi:TetR/AcrR family transcriptional regulator [Labedella endophytica]|jgi:AcrR family transcriptional regulator|uniref:TetR/AcrR family transcriptional regulator n=1 Tax=Labedella endophytica TaxID=1523160 RepID=A0A433JSM9_9MICO|nr:TetR/AcrR family transcriptional regulator [Labedella endophytica]RUR01200.1 TetR/AcrR family transcriptional regulator [Labedella endophytica]
MSRWEPDARGRLLRAAIELFSERGYEATTAAQIAAHAGLTKTTLFRHFADKREILFQGQDVLVEAVKAGVRGAPAEASPMELTRAGVASLCAAHSEDLRDTGRLLDPLLAKTPELQERATFKRSAISEALQHALHSRLSDIRQAGLLADAGVRAYYEGYAAWMHADGTGTLIDSVHEELTAYEAALRRLVKDTPRPASF